MLKKTKKPFINSFLLLLILVFMGCSQHKPSKKGSQISQAQVTLNHPKPTLNSNYKAQYGTANAWEILIEGFSLQQTNNPRADQFERWLSRHPGYINSLVARAKISLPYLIKTIKRNNLPLEVALIPMIESELNNLATSPAGAVGMWQIMPATATSLGLKITHKLDERRGIITATNAALTYLKAFHKTYEGDWSYAITAYNAGAGNLNKATRKARLAKTPSDVGQLPLNKESRDYYAKITGLKNYIIKSGTKYPKLAFIPIQNFFQSVLSQPTQSFSSLADQYNTDYDVIASINAQFITQKLPAQSTHVLVPKGDVYISARNVGVYKTIPNVIRHIIDHGETLSELAQTYQTTITKIKAFNQLNNNQIQANKVLLIPTQR